MSSSVLSLQEENRVLQGELARLEDLLAHSRADRDELAIKYGAISERVRGPAGVLDGRGVSLCLSLDLLVSQVMGLE